MSAETGTQAEVGEGDKTATTSSPRGRSGYGVGLLLAVGVILLIAGLGVGYLAGTSMAPQPKAAAPAGTDHLYLSITPGIYNSSLDEFSPGNFTVPAHTQVEFTITNYDSGVNVPTSTYLQVAGTVNNLIYVNGAATGVSSVSTTDISHTISVLSTGFNVPLPAASATAPSVVTFVAYFNQTGSFEWQCMTPCDPTSMSSMGFMMGTLTVE